jgi:AcrR family transcriptional regulator
VSRRRFAPRSGRTDADRGRSPLPPALAKLPATRGRLSKEFVEQDQRNRILVAGLTVFGGKGFAAATVQDLITEASVSSSTFYRCFPGKAACLRAVHDEVLTWLEEEARDAAGGAEGWADAVRAVTERLVELLAEDPRLVRLCAFEPLLGDPEVLARHEAAVAQLAAALRAGRGERPWGAGLPESIEAPSIDGALALAARAIAGDSKQNVRELTRELTEIILAPYLGADDARRATGGPG